MWYALFIFILSTIVLLGFMIYKFRQLRSGSLKINQDFANNFFLGLLQDASRHIQHNARKGTRITILLGLKYSIKATHFLKTKTDAIVAKIHLFAIHHEKRIVEAHVEDSKSGFLETINEYKTTIVKSRKRPSVRKIKVE